MCEQLENILLRKLLSELNLKTYYITNKDHYSYDAVFTTQSGITGIIEAKVRSKEYDDYFLEVSKLDLLINASKSSNSKILYVNFLPTDDPSVWNYILFNISYRTRKWSEGGTPDLKLIRANDKTFISNEKRDKWMILLKYDAINDQRGTIKLSNL
jgi:hypothetical protein